MRKTNRFAALLLSIMMLFSCFFFTSCADDSVHGTYHLAQFVSKDESRPLLVNLDIFTNWFSYGTYIKLVLHEDGHAEFRFKTDGEVETILRGSWSVADDGSLHLLFEDQLTIATLDGRYLILEDETIKGTFKKVLFDFTALTAE